MHLIPLLLLSLLLPPQAPEMKSAAAPSPESVANGAKVFGRYCAACHGKEGKGDGVGGAKLTPKPSNLTDAQWQQAHTDDQIALVIHDGVKDTAMKGYASRVTPKEMADLVGFIRSLK